MTKYKAVKITSIIAVAVVFCCVFVLTACANFGADAPQGISADVREFVKIKDERMVAEAQDYKGYVYKSGDDIMTFRMKSPSNIEAGKAYPLIIFLHGKGDGGTDNGRHMYKSLINSVDKYVKEDCFIMLPQAGYELDWTDNVGDNGENAGIIYNKLLKAVIDANPVNTTRVYLTGMSMGGNGTMFQAFNHSEIYAAAMPLCGYYDMTYFNDMSVLKDMPIWLSHGKLDDVLSWEYSLNMYNALLVGGNTDVRITYIDDGYHDITGAFYDITGAFYDNADVWEWLLSKRKAD